MTSSEASQDSVKQNSSIPNLAEPLNLDDAELVARELRAYRTINWLALNGKEFEPLSWAIDGLIPEGYGLIVAPPKAGKSWFVLDIAAACSTGQKALGYLPTKERPVLYLALEDGQRRLQERLNILKDARGMEPNINLEMVTEADSLETDILITQFIKMFGERKPLIILDTIGRVMPAKAAGENEYQRDYRFGAKLKKYVAAMPGGTLLAVHHTNKGVHSDFQNAVSGTQGIAGAADFTAVIQRQRNEDEAVLSITGRDVPEAEYGMTFSAGLWSVVGGDLSTASDAATEIRAAQAQSEATANLGDRMAEIVSFVDRKAGSAVESSDIAKEFGLSRKDAGSYLARAAKKGLIAKQGRGKYVSNVSNVSISQVEGTNQLSTGLSNVSNIEAPDNHQFDTFESSVENIQSHKNRSEQGGSGYNYTFDTFYTSPEGDAFRGILLSSLSAKHGLSKERIARDVPQKFNPADNLDPALKRLEEDGLIVQDFRGDYRLTQGDM
ncbi:AAA family ATPase [Corynebacterium amycolatum]|uniref:AAA family ATPase n=1 Tax=Corynebacterium amycolatum TaxID=43765 RepID=UPI000E18F3E4|nr:AAA family ATPase [Corynebacterium amycolatum]STC40685.1 Uncharacterised protein [Corynebacterium amycolatum]